VFGRITNFVKFSIIEPMMPARDVRKDVAQVAE
jgi:hypothetical protein